MFRVLWLAALLLFPISAHAQDALAVGAGVYKKVIENNRIRVLEGNFKPGTKVPTHHFGDHMLYPLTAGSLVFKVEGKTPYEMTFAAGEAQLLPAQTLATENVSDKPVRTLIVEFKQAAATVAAKPAARKARRGGGRKARRGRRR